MNEMEKLFSDDKYDEFLVKFLMSLEPFLIVQDDDIQSIGDEISQAVFITGAHVQVGYNVR